MFDADKLEELQERAWAMNLELEYDKAGYLLYQDWGCGRKFVWSADVDGLYTTAEKIEKILTSLEMIPPEFPPV